MSVYEIIRRRIGAGTIMYTPSKKRKPFEVESTDDPLTFRVGKKKGRIKVPKNCLDGIPAFLGKGWVRSGSMHQKAIEDTLEDYLDNHKGYVGGSLASYVVPVLQEVGIIELRQHDRHLEIKLIE